MSHAGCSVWKYWKKGRKKKRRFACCLSGTGAPFHFWSRRRSPTGRFGELGGVDEGISAVGGKGMRTSCVSRDQSTNRSSAAVAEAGTDGLLRRAHAQQTKKRAGMSHSVTSLAIQAGQPTSTLPPTVPSVDCLCEGHAVCAVPYPPPPPPRTDFPAAAAIRQAQATPTLKARASVAQQQ